ncbi:MAG: hypothetical protein AAGJ46_05455 [Planctomycetota bacterium]
MASDAPNPTAAAPTDLYIGGVSRLAKLFGYATDDLGQFTPITPDGLPEDYRTLLAHTGHMTVTLEAFHNSLVDVAVLQERTGEESYAREIVLARQSDGVAIQYGLVRLWEGGLPADVRAEIRSREIPLGRVLIRHGLMREVELLSLWRIQPGPALTKHLAADDAPVFGRTAQILVDHRPTVQLLEIINV